MTLILCETCKGEKRITIERPGFTSIEQDCPNCTELDEIKLPTYSQNEWRTTTKVKDLIEALKKCNPEAFVISEGCDCTGEVVSISGNYKEIQLCREN